MIRRREILKLGGMTLTLPVLNRSLPGQSSGAAAAKLPNLTAGVKPLDPGDYEERRERARALMAAQAIDGLFIGGGANLSYFTSVGWGASERTFGAVLDRRGRTVWICPAFELERAKESLPAGAEVRVWEEHESPYKLIAGAVREGGGGKLAVAPNAAAFQIFGLRRDAPGLEIVDGAAVTDVCRGTKTAKEIAYLDLANKISKLAYREAFRGLKAGLTPRDLAAAISAAHTQLGAAGGGGPQFGPSTAFPHGSRAPRTLAEGTIIMVDGGCGVEGYRSDITRTIVFGSASDKIRRVWDVVRKAQVAALQAARPGARCEEVDAAARKVVEDAGFGPGYKYFVHRVGHGIGLEGHEYPYLVKGNTLMLEPGMTFSNEPGIYIYGEFGVRTEDCMVITPEGARTLGGMEAVSIEEPFAAE